MGGGGGWGVCVCVCEEEEESLNSIIVLCVFSFFLHPFGKSVHKQTNIIGLIFKDLVLYRRTCAVKASTMLAR